MIRATFRIYRHRIPSTFLGWWATPLLLPLPLPTRSSTIPMRPNSSTSEPIRPTLSRSIAVRPIFNSAHRNATLVRKAIPRSRSVQIISHTLSVFVLVYISNTDFDQPRLFQTDTHSPFTTPLLRTGAQSWYISIALKSLSVVSFPH